jgi:hypothetical protein
MCGVSQRELDALNNAKALRKDMWIWNLDNLPIGLVKVEKLVWQDDGSEAILFHLYRIPRGEQPGIKVKKIHRT